jgi:hypothetical protein
MPPNSFAHDPRCTFTGSSSLGTCQRPQPGRSRARFLGPMALGGGRSHTGCPDPRAALSAARHAGRGSGRGALRDASRRAADRAGTFPTCHHDTARVGRAVNRQLPKLGKEQPDVNVARIDVEIGEEVGELCMLVLEESRNPRARRLAQRNRRCERIRALHRQWLQAAERNPGGRTETMLRQQVLEELRWRRLDDDDDEPPRAA